MYCDVGCGVRHNVESVADRWTKAEQSSSFCSWFFSRGLNTRPPVFMGPVENSWLRTAMAGLEDLRFLEQSKTISRQILFYSYSHLADKE